jgi:hypothetical protein
MYQDGSVVTSMSPLPDMTETYDTETWVIAIGVDLHF